MSIPPAPPLPTTLSPSPSTNSLRKHRHKRKRPSDRVLEEALGSSSFDDDSEIVVVPQMVQNVVMDNEENRKRKDNLRDTIDILTYENRLEWIGRNLEMQKERDELKLQEEIEDLRYRLNKKQLLDALDVAKLEVELKQKHQELDNWVRNKPQYAKFPVTLNLDDPEYVDITLSDRIIPLNGVITYATSDYVTERIEYYNNHSQELPIFVVIDYSPGGSVMSGYRILKAIECSPAPVYVICKSFCASMSATILCLAPHSYAYPNAIILHHQIWSRSSGNLTQHRESLVDLQEWWVRLAGPLVKKLNVTLEEWVLKLYENNSDGDWKVFADEAKKMGWIDGIIKTIRETGCRENPDTKKPSLSGLFFWQAPNQTSTAMSSPEKRQKEEPLSTTLPELLPLDHYWLYNPNHYWK